VNIENFCEYVEGTRIRPPSLVPDGARGLDTVIGSRRRRGMLPARVLRMCRWITNTTLDRTARCKVGVASVGWWPPTLAASIKFLQSGAVLRLATRRNSNRLSSLLKHLRVEIILSAQTEFKRGGTMSALGQKAPQVDAGGIRASGLARPIVRPQ
jgi:hypothetical protein